MKKILVLVVLLTVAFFTYANENTHSKKDMSFSFLQKTNSSIKYQRLADDEVENEDDSDDFDEESPFDLRSRRLSILSFVLGGVFSGSSIPLAVSFVVPSLQGNFAVGYLHYSLFLVFSVQSLIASGMLFYLGGTQYSQSKNYDPYVYKYEMSKVMRNVGIVVLSTSVIPALATIPYILDGLEIGVYSKMINWAFSISYFILSGIQIGLGVGFLCCGQSRLNYWLDVISSFNVSMVHDDKKDLTEGYSVQIGARIRL